MKQPYIPFYVGDYLKDTRILPLSVRGFWVDILLYMWHAEHRGIIKGTISEFSRMAACTEKEADFAIDLLMQKNIANVTKDKSGEIEIQSRRMVHDAKISEIRSKAAKSKNLHKQNKSKTINKTLSKKEQNPDIDIDYDNEDNIIIVPFDSENFQTSWNAWKRYRKEQHKFEYKSPSSEQAALTKLSNISNHDEQMAIAIIGEAMANGWSGFYQLKNDKAKSAIDRSAAIIARHINS